MRRHNGNRPWIQFVDATLREGGKWLPAWHGANLHACAASPHKAQGLPHCSCVRPEALNASNHSLGFAECGICR